MIHLTIAIIAVLLAYAANPKEVAEKPVQWKKWRTAVRPFAFISLAVSASSLILVGSLGQQVAYAETLFKDNFNDGNANGWTPQGGSWAVLNGEYVGQGTSITPSQCGLSHEYVTTLIDNKQTKNAEIEVDMRSIERVDKFVILRSINVDNQVVLNLRAERPGEFPADLSVEETRDDQTHDCQQIFYTPEFSVLIPSHQVGQTIHVHAILIGSRLRVLLDKVLVLDRTFPFSRRIGQVGLGTIAAGTTAFDNVEVRFNITDQDGDGVRDTRDLCPGTVLPEQVPTKRLGQNRFASIDDDLAFETEPPPPGPGEPGFTLLDTAGCSCEQIIARQHLGFGHREFGCSRGVIKAFSAVVGLLLKVANAGGR